MFFFLLSQLNVLFLQGTAPLDEVTVKCFAQVLTKNGPFFIIFLPCLFGYLNGRLFGYWPNALTAKLTTCRPTYNACPKDVEQGFIQVGTNIYMSCSLSTNQERVIFN